MTAKRIDIIDVTCEEYSQEVLGFSDTILSGNPTPFYDPIVSTTSPTLTPFGNSDFLLEEVDAFLAVEDEPTSSDYYQSQLVLSTNKDKLFELAKIPLNENCPAMLLKKLLKKLGDPGKFLIPCDFLGMDVCHALADLDASINLMPLSIWKKLSLPEVIPTRMNLKLADRSITRPKEVVEDVFIKVGKFYFPTNCVVVDFEADPRVTLILAVTFNLNQTTRYSSTYDDLSVNRIDIIDVAREEYSQEILGFSSNSSGGSPTLNFEPILCYSSPSLTPFEGSDFILEEIEA
nr:reverse transcriptase domain-containing protein [Tanacetum cinerariifolium]